MGCGLEAPQCWLMGNSAYSRSTSLLLKLHASDLAVRVFDALELGVPTGVLSSVAESQSSGQRSSTMPTRAPSRAPPSLTRAPDSPL